MIWDIWSKIGSIIFHNIFSNIIQNNTLSSKIVHISTFFNLGDADFNGDNSISNRKPTNRARPMSQRKSASGRFSIINGVAAAKQRVEKWHDFGL